jgi:hypothetical protein
MSGKETKVGNEGKKLKEIRNRRLFRKKKKNQFQFETKTIKIEVELM